MSEPEYDDSRDKLKKERDEARWLVKMFTIIPLIQANTELLCKFQGKCIDEVLKWGIEDTTELFEQIKEMYKNEQEKNK